MAKLRKKSKSAEQLQSNFFDLSALLVVKKSYCLWILTMRECFLAAKEVKCLNMQNNLITVRTSQFLRGQKYLEKALYRETIYCRSTKFT